MIVVDTSIAAKWVFPEDDSELALALLTDHIARGEPVVGPHLLPVEFTNVVRQRMRREGLAGELARACLDHFLSLPIALRPRTDTGRQSLHRRALAVAERYGLPATYDAHYVALAELLDCDAWTADERLLRELRDEVPRLRALASYQRSA